MKNKIWKILAAAGSFAVLSSCQMTMRPYAESEFRIAEYVVSSPEQCRRVLMEIASQALPGKRQECYLTGKDYEPESLVIAQMFPDIINISNTKIKDFQKDGHRYVTCRIGFERADELEKAEDPVDENDDIVRYYYKAVVDSQYVENELYVYEIIGDASNFDNWKLKDIQKVKYGFN